ncbi:MAG: hypothetical protein MJA83_18380, partial [Gammaproteobacteria bacterium]|nr:hypothetical protein [Gammaproteobacteria bacterium]
MSFKLIKQSGRISLIASALVVALLLMINVDSTKWFTHGFISQAEAAIEFGFKHGLVTTRSLVPGPNGLPIFVEYDEAGNVVDIIGEASEADGLDGAFVMSGDAYRGFVQMHDDFLAQFGDTSARGSYLVTNEEYDRTDFITLTGDAAQKPPLMGSTQSVLVRGDDALVNPIISPVLLQFPIDMRQRQELDEDVRSVLIDSEGRVRHTAPVNIGYRVAFWADPDSSNLSLADAQRDRNRFPQQGEAPTGPVAGALLYT